MYLHPSREQAKACSPRVKARHSVCQVKTSPGRARGTRVHSGTFPCRRYGGCASLHARPPFRNCCVLERPGAIRFSRARRNPAGRESDTAERARGESQSSLEIFIGAAALPGHFSWATRVYFSQPLRDAGDCSDVELWRRPRLWRCSNIFNHARAAQYAGRSHPHVRGCVCGAMVEP